MGDPAAQQRWPASPLAEAVPGARVIVVRNDDDGVAVRGYLQRFYDIRYQRPQRAVLVRPTPGATDRATELVRLCLPGGVIASTAWSLDSVYSKIGGIVGGFLAGDDEDDAEAGPMPTDWADPHAVRSIFAGLPVTVETRACTVRVHWPSTDAVIDALPEFSPLVWAVEKLRADGTWDAACAALAEMLAAEAVATSPELVVEVPYAVATAMRSG